MSPAGPPRPGALPPARRVRAGGTQVRQGPGPCCWATVVCLAPFPAIAGRRCSTARRRSTASAAGPPAAVRPPLRRPPNRAGLPWPARDARVHGADAVVPVEQRRKLLGILGRQPEHDSRLTPGFLERVPHVAGNGRHRIGHQTVRHPPPLPSPLERRCGQLSLEHQFWIPHGEPSPHSDGTFPPDGGPPGVARCASLMPCSAPRTAGSRTGRTQALNRACCGYPSVGMATSMGSRCHRAGAITQSR